MDRSDRRYKSAESLHGVFAGGFGHTYGNENIEIMYIPGDHDYGYPHRYWKDALNDTGAQQMIHLRRLMESRSFLKRIPDQSIIKSDIGKQLQFIQATRAEDGSYAFVYIPDGRPVTVDLTKISGSAADCTWYDPRSGSLTTIGQFANIGTMSSILPTPPLTAMTGCSSWMVASINQPATVKLISPGAANSTGWAFITPTASASNRARAVAKVDGVVNGTAIRHLHRHPLHAQSGAERPSWHRKSSHRLITGMNRFIPVNRCHLWSGVSSMLWLTHGNAPVPTAASIGPRLQEFAMRRTPDFLENIEL